jgi:NAD(P)-dependent dehydrogenase (short-subunit alcohol dehydrogenase family)
MTSSSQPRTAVVTGASSGIGKAAARGLIQQGWRVVGIGRDAGRCAAAQAEINAAIPDARFEMLRADLSLMSEAARIAQDVADRTDRVDALLNNAGGVKNSLIITREGLEATFAANHLGHFLLTTRLLPLLRAAARRTRPGAVRIVNVSSSGHEYSPGLDWEDLQRLKNFSTGGAYTNAKLANVLFARELARRLADDGIVAHAMHPGVVASNFASHADEAMRRYFATLQALPPEDAADTLVWLATDPEPGRVSGGYYHQRQAVPTSAAAQDAVAAERLWIESERLLTRLNL